MATVQESAVDEGCSAPLWRALSLLSARRARSVRRSAGGVALFRLVLRVCKNVMEHGGSWWCEEWKWARVGLSVFALYDLQIYLERLFWIH